MTPEQRFEAWWSHVDQGALIASNEDARKIWFAGYAQGQAGMREAAAKIVEQQGCNEYESAKIKQHGESCPISIAQAIRTLPTEEAPHAEG